jgi:hypothetical protein
MLPELSKFWRQDRFSDVNHLANEGLRLRTKREVDATLRAEQVSNDRITTTFDALEQQRRSTFTDHAPMDLGKLEVRINLGFDSDDFVFSGE